MSIPTPKGFIDNCVDVHCRKCGKFLACVMQKAEVLCRDCSTAARLVWTVAKRPLSHKRDAIRKRASRQALRPQRPMGSDWISPKPKGTHKECKVKPL